MKKTITLFCIAALILSVCLPVSAAEGTDYSFPDYQLTITVPSTWTVYQPGSTADKVETVNKNASLAAYPGESTDTELDLVLTTDDTSKTAYNWKLLESLRINPFLDNKPVTDTFGTRLTTGENAAFTSYGRFKNSQALFLKLSGEETTDGVTTYLLQYRTVVNGQNIEFRMSSKAKISSKIAKELQGIVKSTLFANVADLPEEVTDHAAAVIETNKISMRNMFWSFSALDTAKQIGIMALLYLIFPLLLVLFKRPLSTGGGFLLVVIIAAILLIGQTFVLSALFIRVTAAALFLPAIIWSIAGYFLLAPTRKLYDLEYEKAMKVAWDNYYKTHESERPVPVKV